MIDVRMGEHNLIDRAGFEGETAVAVSCLAAAALEEAAFEQDLAVAMPQFMHGPGNCACGAPKINFHG